MLFFHPKMFSLDFTPSSPMSLQSHFNQREGPPHPPSPLQFPGMASAMTLTPPHHSEIIFFIFFSNIQANQSQNSYSKQTFVHVIFME